ncbi:hypothetical protein EDB83DRAFT_1405609 [Lactarius deliciosus]|nr:hypothetical protein EDB83DRAFT_1405609 [Lactarius deliciosus]
MMQEQAETSVATEGRGHGNSHGLIRPRDRSTKLPQLCDDPRCEFVRTGKGCSWCRPWRCASLPCPAPPLFESVATGSPFRRVNALKNSRLCDVDSTPVTAAAIILWGPSLSLGEPTPFLPASCSLTLAESLPIGQDIPSPHTPIPPCLSATRAPHSSLHLFSFMALWRGYRTLSLEGQLRGMFKLLVISQFISQIPHSPTTSHRYSMRYSSLTPNVRPHI